jgi:hypothetical protein
MAVTQKTAFMSLASKREVLVLLRPRYARAGKKHKIKILDEFCATWNCHRKSAIRVLNRAPARRFLRVAGRPPIYGAAHLPALQTIWLAAQQPCGKRLAAALPLWLPYYEATHRELTRDVRTELLTASAATLDRLLAATRLRHPHGRATTRPGTLLRQQIPIRTDHWDVTQPGFVEADTVALCGESLAGDFLWTLTLTDIFSQWTEPRAMWNRGAAGTLAQLQDIEAGLPFALLGFDCDNGGEFLNHHLLRHYQERPQPVHFTRSRPYHKNDNARVEQKNWTHVRQLLGYQRYDNPAVVARVNALCRGEWSQLLNYFCPAMKLVEKIKDGSRYHRRYDAPQTPCQRLLASGTLTPEQARRLQTTQAQLNPFNLQKQIDRQLKVIFALARQPAIQS